MGNSFVSLTGSGVTSCVQGLTLRVVNYKAYWHEQDAVICPAKLGDAVQEHSRHLLVSVFYETEHLEGKTTHLTPPVLKNRRLWVFVAPVSKDHSTHTHTANVNTKSTDFKCSCALKYSLRDFVLAFIRISRFESRWMGNGALLWFLNHKRAPKSKITQRKGRSAVHRWDSLRALCNSSPSRCSICGDRKPWGDGG